MSVLDVRIGQGAAAVQGRTVMVQRLLWAMIGWLVVMQIAVVRSVFPPIGLIQAALLAVPAVLLARGWRHAAVLTAVFVGVVLLAAVPFLIKDLSEPGAVVTFVWNVVAAPLLIGLFVVSVRAARASRRTAS